MPVAMQSWIARIRFMRDSPDMCPALRVGKDLNSLVPVNLGMNDGLLGHLLAAASKKESVLAACRTQLEIPGNSLHLT